MAHILHECRSTEDGFQVNMITSFRGAITVYQAIMTIEHHHIEASFCLQRQPISSHLVLVWNGEEYPIAGLGELKAEPGAFENFPARLVHRHNVFPIGQSKNT